MNTEDTKIDLDRDDPWGDREALRQALSHPDLRGLVEEGGSTEATRYAAFRAAHFLGRCRLFGVNLEESDGELPAMVAAVATEELHAHLKVASELTTSLAARYDETEDPVECESMCADLIDLRMMLWAVVVSLVDAAENQWTDPKEALLSERLEQCLFLLDDWDEQLQQNIGLLSIVAGLPLLDNLRNTLADEFRQQQPWWLDGSLEEEAARIERDALSSAVLPRRSIGPRWGDVAPEISSYAIAAQSPSRGRSHPTLRWKSPFGTSIAKLRFVAESKGDPSEPVSFLITRNEDPLSAEPAIEFAGKTVVILGCERVLDEKAEAQFTLEDLSSNLDERVALSVDGYLWDWCD